MTIDSLLERKGDFEFGGSKLTSVGGICLVVGIAILGIRFAGDPTRAWGSLLMNLMFFYCIALGGVMFGAMQDTIGALWGRPIRRVHESFGNFLLPGTLLLIAFVIVSGTGVAGAGGVYKWIAEPEMLAAFPGKNIWLTPMGFMIRNVAILIVIFALTRMSMSMSLKADRLIKAGKIKEALQEGERVRARLRFWSGPMLVVYGVLFSFFCFDLTMSLSPLWFSTLWGGWSFAVLMVTLLASTLVAMFLLKGSSLGSVMGRQQFHDVGKMMHGFTIFFAYLTFAHVLTYWYGNVPEETEYFLHRMHGPWLPIIIIAPILSFALPLFVLIPKASKWYGPVAVPMAAIILGAQWLSYLIVVMPETTTQESFASVPFVTELGGLFTIGGVFLISVAAYFKSAYAVPLGDPLLAESLNSGH